MDLGVDLHLSTVLFLQFKVVLYILLFVVGCMFVVSNQGGGAMVIEKVEVENPVSNWSAGSE